MLRFLTFCLLATPFVQGLSVPKETAPSLTVLKTDRELEEEIYYNITRLAPKAVFVPDTLNENGEHGPVHVKVNAYVRDILEIKAVDNNLYDWTLDLTFRQKWNDKRLAFDVTHHPDFKHMTLNAVEGMKSIWKPDTFFSQSIRGEFHTITTPNSLIWVYPNGDVLYSTRLSVTLRCKHIPTTETPEKKEEGEEKESDLVCPLRLSTYAFTTEKLVYEWDEDETTKKSIEVTDTLYLPHYTLDKVVTELRTGHTRIGDWSGLVANFHFSHK